MNAFVARTRYFLVPLVTVLVLPLVLSSGSLATEVLVFAMAALACNLLLGYAGLMSFGQGIFFGCGSYALGLLLTKTGVPLFAVLVLVLAAGALIAAVVGWIAIRQKGIYFVMLTLALAQAFYFLAFSVPSVTGGDNGLLGVPMPPLTLFGATLLPNASLWQYYTFVAILFVLVFAGLQRVVDSIFGRTLLAMRDNPDRTTALGYNINHLKLVAFMISGAITALAGALYAMMTGVAPLENIDLNMSEIILVIAIIGGTGSLPASVLGAIFYVIVSNWLSHIWPRWLMIFGFLLMAISLYLQGGLWSACQMIFGRLVPQRRTGAKGRGVAP
ncbi:MAG: branched-chain amino acid ABC transporter permease [Castellaniella sp.]|uniref:branched-chain amino acid ABC transporter permease n=1 Tax=Castellaniella sp. TaxID=1955812 RepID=UPI0012102801|nr:branched-chain amino acid ABC transporter permease [Castellaniella sp.]TAN29093.1 MAG: branched-chain amino acid ABC transporter permease [Castellaniella sp.]